MAGTVRINLDSASQRLLQRLASDLGWTPSRVVQEALRLFAACHGQPRRKIARIGQFRSGVPDLGSNKVHLKNFGR